jgi:predicted XRE-type DNA-binding protein
LHSGFAWLGRITRGDIALRRNISDLVKSSGNVFADLGISAADEKQIKVLLAVAINQIILNQKISQIEAAMRASRVAPMALARWNDARELRPKKPLTLSGYGCFRFPLARHRSRLADHSFRILGGLLGIG